MSSQRSDQHRSPAEAPTVDLASERTLDGPGSQAPADPDHALSRGAPPVALLELGSELVGRFQIARVLGEGGMGTVYVARDTTLGRDVAIKVHHAAAGARRLRREAVAMARLAHPNVVTVFEVGELEGRPFVVMEYVPGTTLRAWLASRRSVREILAMLIAAGEGLAAAHGAGLVHRDIKPENVLIGADGRARVGDFGLARDLDSRDDEPGASAGSVENLSTPVTQTGAVLGTPAYMSPEQFAGEPVDARADQFAFCVTAWEALWGERPFEGSSYAQLHAAIALGKRRAPPAGSKVPARVRTALERGLSVDPAHRFPSLHALLDAMRPASRRRRRWAIAGGAVALAAAGAVLAVVRTDHSCDDAGVAELAAVRRDLPDLLLARGAVRISLAARVLQEDYRAGFLDHARAACRADRAREGSPERIARSRVCFSITARTAALSLAGADPARPMDVLRRLRRLAPDDRCRNETYLLARPAAPSDPVLLDALIDATATLALGFEAIEDHDRVQLQRAFERLQASPARSDPAISAGAMILRGWLALDRGQVAETRKLFVDAYYAGRAIDDEQVMSVALTLLIEHGADIGFEPGTVADWLRTALADADRIRPRSPWLAGRIYTVAARAADAAGDARAALAHIAQARAVLDRGDPTRIETYVVEGAVLMWSGQVDAGVAAYESALAQRIAYLGPDDPEVAALQSDYAASLLEVNRLEPALRAADRAARIINGVADPSDDRVDAVRVNLAAVLIGAGQDAEAVQLLDTARANNVARLGETNTIVANIDVNLAAIYNGRGEHDRAIAALDSALAIQEKLRGPDRAEVADVLYNLAASYRFKHDSPRAIAAARRAAQIYGARSLGSDRHRTALTMIALAANEAGDYAQALSATETALGFAAPPESPQTQAWAQLERARALIGVHRGAEARPLLAAARTGYDSVHMAERVRQVDELLAKLR